MNPTKRQMESCQQLKDRLLSHASCGGRLEVEVKEERLQDAGDHVEYWVKVGLVADEGTAAEMYSRTARQVFVGKRGGVVCRTVVSNGEVRNVRLVGLSKAVNG